MLFQLAAPVTQPMCGGSYKVRLSDDARDCVVYLGVHSGGEFFPLGTGFLLSYGTPTTSYLVTAAHVARALSDDHFVVRMNRKEGGEAQEIEIDNPQWTRHQDKAVDIAVMEFAPPFQTKHRLWPGHALASETKLV